MHYTQLAKQLLAKDNAIHRQQSKSGGKGGQHANTANTKAELYFAIPDSKILTDDQKDRLLDQLDLSNEGVLRITYDNNRSLQQNKKACKKIFIDTLATALTPHRKRNTDIPKEVLKKMKQHKKRNKQHQSKKKERRKNIDLRDIDSQTT